MPRWFESRNFRRLNRLHLLLVGGLLCLQSGADVPTRAEDGPAAANPPANPAPEKAAPIGQFLTISGAVDDVVFGRVNRTALALKARAQQEKRRGVLVLEIHQGSSPFHQVLGLANFLTTEKWQLASKSL